MDRKLVLLSILFVLVLVACSLTQAMAPQQEETIIGSGKAATETRPVKDFSSIFATGNGTLYIEQGSAPSLTVTADDNILPLLESRVRGGKLILSPKDKKKLESKVNIEYRVTLQDLSSLEGTGNIDIQGAGIDTDSLKVRVDGNSNAHLSGNANNQVVTLSGNSFYDSQDLEGQEGQFTLEGNSGALVNVSNQLEADLSGNSTLEYIGSPQITQKVEDLAQLRRH